MKPFDDLLERAKSDPRHIVLAEGEDPRVVEGGIRALREGVAHVTLLGRATRVRQLLQVRRAATACRSPWWIPRPPRIWRDSPWSTTPSVGIRAWTPRPPGRPCATLFTSPP